MKIINGILSISLLLNSTTYAIVSTINFVKNKTDKEINIINTEIPSGGYLNRLSNKGWINFERFIIIGPNKTSQQPLFVPWRISPTEDKRGSNFLDFYIGGSLEYSLQEDINRIVINGNVCGYMLTDPQRTYGVIIAPHDAVLKNITPQCEPIISPSKKYQFVIY